MTIFVVVDSGILLADLLPGEPLHTQSKMLLAHWQRESVQLAAPTLFLYEVVAVVRKAVYQERLTSEQGSNLVDRALDYPIQFHFGSDLLKRGYALATQYNRPRAYDAQYLALAEKLDCELWTTDERLFNAVREQLPWVKWLSNFSQPQDAPTEDAE